MSNRLFDVVKTNDDLQKIVRAVAHGIDATDVQDALEELGLDVEVDTIDWNTWSQIEISGGENETGVIITLVVKEIEIGFDRLSVDIDPLTDEQRAKTREAVARAHYQAYRDRSPGTLTWETEPDFHKQRFYDSADVVMTKFDVREKRS